MATARGNSRIRHGRTAFTGSGERLQQGCYAGLDALASTLAVLEREGVAAVSEPKGAGGAWTEGRRRSDKGRRRFGGARKRAGDTT